MGNAGRYFLSHLSLSNACDTTKVPYMPTPTNKRCSLPPPKASHEVVVLEAVFWDSGLYFRRG
jgi:hypothetical protein